MASERPKMRQVRSVASQTTRNTCVRLALKSVGVTSVVHDSLLNLTEAQLEQIARVYAGYMEKSYLLAGDLPLKYEGTNGELHVIRVLLPKPSPPPRKTSLRMSDDA